MPPNLLLPVYPMWTQAGEPSADFEQRYADLTDLIADGYSSWINVMNPKYGVVLGGDARPGFQAALDDLWALRAGGLFVPAHTYDFLSFFPAQTTDILQYGAYAGTPARTSIRGQSGARLRTALCYNVSGQATTILDAFGRHEKMLIEGIEFENTHPTIAGRTIGIAMSGGANNEMANVTIRDCTFINFQRATSWNGINGGTAERNRFLYTYGRDSGCTDLADPHVAIWAFVQANGQTSNMRVLNNYFDGCTSGDVTANVNKGGADGLVYGMSRGWDIRGNIIKRFGVEGIYPGSRQTFDGPTRYPVVIAGNSIDSTPVTGTVTAAQYSIRSDEFDTNVHGNVLTGTVRGIWLTGTGLAANLSGTRVADNTIDMLDSAAGIGNSYVGIYHASLTDFAITGNTIKWDTAKSSAAEIYGIHLVSVQRGGLANIQMRMGTNPAAQTSGIRFEGNTTTDITVDNVTVDNFDAALDPSASATTFAGCKVGRIYTPRTTVRRRASGTGGFLTRMNVDGGVGNNLGNADATITPGVDQYEQRFESALTVNRVCTVDTTGAINGDRMRVVRTGLGAFTLEVKDIGGGSVKIIPASTAAFVDVIVRGTALLSGYGTL
jgi:hypothetical protein